MERTTMRAHSSIFNFKKYGMILLKIVVVIIMIIAVGRILRYMLIDDSKRYTRIMLHELYNSEENIDVLFLGSSHTFRSFNTKLLDEKLGKNTFNAGSSALKLDGSYALLVEAGKTNDIQEVYLEMYYMQMPDVHAERVNATEIYFISDFMKPSINKYRYLYDATAPEYWVNGFVPARRRWRSIFDSEYIGKNLSRKNTPEYKNYDYITRDDASYEGKGFVTGDTFIEPGTFEAEAFDPILDEQFSEDTKKSLDDIAKYCKEHDIRLTLVVAPMPDFRLINIGYDKYVDQAREQANRLGVDFYDFNLCKEKYFSGEDNLFMDTDHLSRAGANLFSELLAMLRNGEVSESELFYDSYYEKIEHQPDRVYGNIIDENGKVLYAVKKERRGSYGI